MTQALISVRRTVRRWHDANARSSVTGETRPRRLPFFRRLP